jgi:hypothetical protein
MFKRYYGKKKNVELENKCLEKTSEFRFINGVRCEIVTMVWPCKRNE